ncbi:organomercurial transporter MerC [Saccharospirillum salsuginis]|uniref:Mercury transporter MerC n=1 Tax=Saccharospirillum salsuginis TaxID=418750 RepID=A0A918KPC7_9GAMM|nr:organomercurial transporter MerC [Saccharospirillum salsuginis]GGX70864.1 mercury transporter MerC [Saccharospirillum salsuginis]
MNWLSRGADKTGLLGAAVSAMSCGLCFPAAASIGSAIGLGFLAQWEPLFLNILLPLIAGIALLANALGWFYHRQWHRSALGMIGPGLVLLGRLFFSGALLYPGLIIMMVVAVWDLVSPANRRCGPDSCGLPEGHPER